MGSIIAFSAFIMFMIFCMIACILCEVKAFHHYEKKSKKLFIYFLVSSKLYGIALLICLYLLCTYTEIISHRGVSIFSYTYPSAFYILLLNIRIILLFKFILLIFTIISIICTIIYCIFFWCYC